MWSYNIFKKKFECMFFVFCLLQILQHFCFRLSFPRWLGGHLVPVDGPALPDDQLERDEQQRAVRQVGRRKVCSDEVHFFYFLFCLPFCWNLSLNDVVSKIIFVVFFTEKLGSNSRLGKLLYIINCKLFTFVKFWSFALFV